MSFDKLELQLVDARGMSPAACAARAGHTTLATSIDKWHLTLHQTTDGVDNGATISRSPSPALSRTSSWKSTPKDRYIELGAIYDDCQVACFDKAIKFCIYLCL